MCRIPQGFLLRHRDKLLGVYFVDDRNGWVVGDNGLALKTPDGGESWQRVTISEQSFKDVFFIGENGWIVGVGGLILHTDNGGETWGKQASNVEQCLLSVFFLDANKGFTVGVEGTILRTEDAGLSWKILDIDWLAFLPEVLDEMGVFSINLYDVFFPNETSGCIVGEYGIVLYTIDGGKEWVLSQLGDFPTIFSVCFKSDKVGWAVGQHGFFLKTYDGGRNWEKLAIDTVNSLYKIQISNDYGVIVGDHATILTTNDGGKTWVENPQNLPPPYPWFADAWIFPSNPAKILSVGKGVIINAGIYTKR